MQRDKDWLAHLRAGIQQQTDVNVYAQSWAHDVRTLRTGTAHRRVGVVNAAHDEWLQAGLVARTATPFTY